VLTRRVQVLTRGGSLVFADHRRFLRHIGLVAETNLPGRTVKTSARSRKQDRSKLSLIAVTAGIAALLAAGVGYLAGHHAAAPQVRAPLLPVTVVQIPAGAIDR
jgi:hypothetical protein